MADGRRRSRDVSESSGCEENNNESGNLNVTECESEADAAGSSLNITVSESEDLPEDGEVVTGSDDNEHTESERDAESDDEDTETGEEDEEEEVVKKPEEESEEELEEGEEYSTTDEGSDVSEEEQEDEKVAATDETEKPWMNEKRLSGDGEEHVDAAVTETQPDIDEDKSNPAYIPRKGNFFEHDTRTVDGDADPDQNADLPKKKLWVDNKKWSHDLYDERSQMPKSRAELIASYGYDIRTGNEPPPETARRPRGKRGSARGSRSLGDFMRSGHSDEDDNPGENEDIDNNARYGRRPPRQFAENDGDAKSDRGGPRYDRPTRNRGRRGGARYSELRQNRDAGRYEVSEHNRDDSPVERDLHVNVRRTTRGVRQRGSGRGTNHAGDTRNRESNDSAEYSGNRNTEKAFDNRKFNSHDTDRQRGDGTHNVVKIELNSSVVNAPVQPHIRLTSEDWDAETPDSKVASLSVAAEQTVRKDVQNDGSSPGRNSKGDRGGHRWSNETRVTHPKGDVREQHDHVRPGFVTRTINNRQYADAGASNSQDRKSQIGSIVDAMNKISVSEPSPANADNKPAAAVLTKPTIVSGASNVPEIIPPLTRTQTRTITTAPRRTERLAADTSTLAASTGRRELANVNPSKVGMSSPGSQNTSQQMTKPKRYSTQRQRTAPDADAASEPLPDPAVVAAGSSGAPQPVSSAQYYEVEQELAQLPMSYPPHHMIPMGSIAYRLPPGMPPKAFYQSSPSAPQTGSSPPSLMHAARYLGPASQMIPAQGQFYVPPPSLYGYPAPHLMPSRPYCMPPPQLRHYIPSPAPSPAQMLNDVSPSMEVRSGTVYFNAETQQPEVRVGGIYYGPVGQQSTAPVAVRRPNSAIPIVDPQTMDENGVPVSYYQDVAVTVPAQEFVYNYPPSGGQMQYEYTSVQSPALVETDGSSYS